MKLNGSFVALVTPYSKGEVDLLKVKELVEFHIKNGTMGICPAATTGEGPVLSQDERANIIKAVVETSEGVSPSSALAEEILAFCRERLAGFKCPKTIDFTEALPRDPNGKLYKRKLRDPYWQGRDKAI